MDYTIIGEIINSHGVRGEMKIYPLTDDIKRFNKLKTAYIGDNKLKIAIEGVKYHKNLVIIKAKEYDNINQILQFKGNYLYIDDKDRVVLPENHFFIYDLLNSEVFDKDHNLIGILTDVLQGASNDVYVVKNKEKNKEYLIPAVKEFIVNINILEKIIIIDPIDGMIE